MRMPLQHDLHNQTSNEIIHQYLCAPQGQRTARLAVFISDGRRLGQQSRMVSGIFETMNHSESADLLRAQILELVKQYHAVAFPPSKFEPG